MISFVRGVARLAWPPTRRWDRLLRSLDLDPGRLPRPLAPPAERDFIICGSPRTGTTLLAAMLYQPPRVVVAMEPWDGMRLPPAPMFASLRREIVETGALTRQRLDVDALTNEGAVRWCREGASAPPLEVDDDFLLGVKWPAFWRYLELLPDTRFIVCLRHPVEMIASYKKAGGRLVQGLNYDTTFNAEMNRYLESATSDPRLRRVLLFDYIHSRILPYLERPNVFVVRYERWFTDPETLMQEMATFLGVPLTRPAVALRRPEGATLPPDELSLLLETSETADRLGYVVSRPSHEISS